MVFLLRIKCNICNIKCYTRNYYLRLISTMRGTDILGLRAYC